MTQVRKLREDRSWSQQHLATVAGLSARTVQRVEAEGIASLDTRMAIGAAFGIVCGLGGATLGVLHGLSGGHGNGAEYGILGR
jgi:transcriptional regulator with XRE-family HTH domain